MKRLCLIFSLIFAILGQNGLRAQELPKREFRGAWLHIIGNNEIRKKSTAQTQKWICEALDELQRSGCNAVIFQVRPQADAFYASSLEPWSKYLCGEQGRAPSPFWDPLEFICTQAHARGMELHAWLNPYRVTTSEKEVLCESHIARKEPWRIVKYGKQYYFDPGLPQNVDFTLDVIKDIVSRYDVDAIHFDDYFYPYPIKGSDFPDYASFARYGQGYSSKADWRRDNCTALIAKADSVIKAVKPWVRFGISPFGIHRNSSRDSRGSDTRGLSTYDDLYADIPLWVKEDYIDYYAPQLYWKIGHKLADYATLAKWWNDSNFGDHLYIGQNIATLWEPDCNDPSKTQLEEKMRLSRELPNVDGNIWWPGWDLCKNVSGIADSLQTRYQRHPALIPAYTAIDSTPPPPVALFTSSGRLLRWEPVQTDDPMQKACSFVVYRFPPGAEADISKSEYIYCITRANSVKIPASPWRYRYKVSVCDRCWNESAPSKEIEL
ncbi:MAG: family 10 glycosylhydrolase [Bacteroidales bacterium]|nr:family 10 glycosylhydrolase [Bacteroidales bacterium]